MYEDEEELEKAGAYVSDTLHTEFIYHPPSSLMCNVILCMPSAPGEGFHYIPFQLRDISLAKRQPSSPS